jgi:hypothetical protein
MGIAFVVRHGDHKFGILTAVGEREARGAAKYIQRVIETHGCGAQRRIIQTSHEQRAIAFGRAIGIALGMDGPHEEWDALTPTEIAPPLIRASYCDVVVRFVRYRINTRDGFPIPILVTHSTTIAQLIDAFGVPPPNSVPSGAVMALVRTENGLSVSYFPDSEQGERTDDRT